MSIGDLYANSAACSRPERKISNSLWVEEEGECKQRGERREGKRREGKRTSERATVVELESHMPGTIGLHFECLNSFDLGIA